MFCKVKAKEIWNAITNMQEPIPGYQERRIHLKKSIVFGVAAFSVIFATTFVAVAIFSGSKNSACSRIAEDVAKHRSYAPIAMVGGGVLSGAFLFTALKLAETKRLFKLTVQTKTAVEGKDRWQPDPVQPIYWEYDPASPACYLYKNSEGIWTASSEEITGRAFIEKKDKSIEQNATQVIYSELNSFIVAG